MHARERVADSHPDTTTDPSLSNQPEQPTPTLRSVDPAKDQEYVGATYGVIVVAGLVGAVIVAITFLVADLLAGRPPLWTPAVLGSALFLGRSVAQDPSFDPMSVLPVVLGYTMIHGALFVAFASAASAGRVTRFDRHPLTLTAAIWTALLIFVGLEAFFFFGLGLFADSNMALADRLGSGWVALANGLAAIGMTATVAFVARAASRSIHAGHPED